MPPNLLLCNLVSFYLLLLILISYPSFFPSLFPAFWTSVFLYKDFSLASYSIFNCCFLYLYISPWLLPKAFDMSVVPSNWLGVLGDNVMGKVVSNCGEI